MEINQSTYILSIETTGSTCGVTLTQNTEIISEYYTKGANLHDKLLAEFTKRITNDRDIKINDLSAVAISAGPGSFTGLRIGAAFAKALTFSEDIKLIAVPTLEALAYYTSINYHNIKRIIATQYSHKDLLYYQIFDQKANAASSVKFKTISELDSILQSSDFLCGSHHNSKC